MHADVARQAFEFARQLQQGAHVFFLGFALGQQGFGFDGINHLVVFLAACRYQLQRDGLARLVRNQLGNTVAKAIRKVQHPAHVANGRTCRHRTEGHNLAHRPVAVLVLHVVDHAVAVALAKIDVKVGHRHPLRVQKPLEQQVVAQRVQVGDFQCIRHQRTGSRAASRADRAAIGLGPLDEVTHDQKVARKTHLQDGVDLELQPRHVFGPLGVAHRRVGVEVQQPLFQAFKRSVPKIRVGGHAHAIDFGRRVVGQHRLAQLQRQVAALGNFHGVGQC